MKLEIIKETGIEKYQLPDWLANKKQFLCLQPKKLERIRGRFVGETAKAVCIVCDEMIGNVWLPKSQMNPWEYSNPTLKKSLKGKKITEEIIRDRVSPESIKEFGIASIMKYLKGGKE